MLNVVCSLSWRRDLAGGTHFTGPRNQAHHGVGFWGGLAYLNLPIAWESLTSPYSLTLKTLKLLWLSKVEWTVLSFVCVATSEYEGQLQQQL